MSISTKEGWNDSKSIFNNATMEKALLADKGWNNNQQLFEDTVPVGTVLWSGSTGNGVITLKYPVASVPTGLLITVGNGTLSGSLPTNSNNWSIPIYSSSSIRSAGTFKVVVKPNWSDPGYTFEGSTFNWDGSSNGNSIAAAATAGDAHSTIHITQNDADSIKVTGTNLVYSTSLDGGYNGVGGYLHWTGYGTAYGTAPITKIEAY